MQSIIEILRGDNLVEKKALFQFNSSNSPEQILLKFDLWSRYFFPQYYNSKPAKFHHEINKNNLDAYLGNVDAFVDIAFRGAAKTSMTKLFIGYVIANDLEHKRGYFKVLSADDVNAKQIVTDIYNMFITPQVRQMYPEIFQQTAKKREETMASFTTSTGVKVIADTVNVDQRGALQEEKRPDFILFEDFETRKTLRSAKNTKSIWDNMEEARTGLAKGGACVYNCNYLSEMGNVHKLIAKQSERWRVLVVPIRENGVSTWPERYSEAEIDEMAKTDDDFEGERMCKPSSAKDILFDRDTLDKMPVLAPIREVNGFKIFQKYNPSHRYGSGHDVAGGVGLDSSTSVFIDFDQLPCQVVATYKDNLIKPDIFGHEIGNQSESFGKAIAGVESNNYGHTTILVCRQNRTNLYKTEGKMNQIDKSVPVKYGWETNAATKPKMLFELKKAIEDGLLVLNDKDLISEAKAYSRNELMDKEVDPRLATRHFDLLIACAIAWQMRNFARVKSDKPKIVVHPM